MATAPFPGQWSVDADLTGNSAFAVDASNILWMVSESTASGAAVFTSANYGITFAQVAAIPNVESSLIAFDPAVTLDSTGNLHFIGQIEPTPNDIQLVKYTWTPATSTLSGPFTIDTGGAVGADYDLVALSNGNCYIVSCLLTSSQELIQGFEIDAAGSVVATDTYISQNFSTGNRYNSVTLFSPDGVLVEIYLGSHPKAVTFQDLPISITLYLRTFNGWSASTAYAAAVTVYYSGSSYLSLTSVPATTGAVPGTNSAVWQLVSPSVLTTFQARHVDNRLTVIGDGPVRYLAQGYYTQSQLFLVGNLLIGNLQVAGGAWTFQSFTGTPTQSLVEPTLSLSPDGLVLAYITKDFTAFPAVDSPVSIRSLNPSTGLLTSRTDFPYNATATFLRGTKSVLPALQPWGFLAQRAGDGTARFYTGYNSPPIVTLSPTVLTPALLGAAYRFDASGSFSPNLNPLVFTWTLSDPTGAAVFVSTGSQATLTLPKSVGPALQTLTVTVSVVSTDALGNPLHPPVTQSCTVTYPLVSPPVIASTAPIPVNRNTSVSYTPTVTDAEGGLLSYQWAQTAGTPMKVLSALTTPTLVFTSNGALIGGEALTFQLTVTDGINAPVVGTFTFDVAARAADPATEVLNRATWSGTLAQRNTTQTWGAPVTSTLVTEFTKVKRGSLIGGGNVYLLIGPDAALVQKRVGTVVQASYHVYSPNVADTILDAIHSDYNATILLTSSGELLQFPPNATLTDTDNAVESLALSTVTAQSYTAMQATPSFGGQRVLTLYGASGVLMLEVETTTLQVVEALELSMASGFLYGADAVDFVRTSDVESLRTGEVLVGTVDGSGNTYETRIDLVSRSILSTLDATTLQNPTVTTGEMLFQPMDSYAGQPLAPVLSAAVQVPGGYQLSWTKTRPDLVTSYYLNLSTDGVTFTLQQVLSSGTSTSVVLTGLLAGSTYWFNVQANSGDGPSPLSNTVQVFA